ncbi:MAG: division/cell wall cluster transcriptional repressor MraZ [Bacteroidales bacterium]|jgi:division/cell wall cluster transcriptional repressor MraZ|nr:division/cell wall cluster transcriptional repressor MraZ [Bacteroidales bacterium]
MRHLTGTEYCKVDVNERFKMPKKFLEQLNLSSTRLFCVRKKLDDNALELFTDERFQKEMDWITTYLNSDGDDEEQLLFNALTNIKHIYLDDADRLPLPKELKQVAEIGNEVVIKGVGGHFELYSKEDYEKQCEAIKQSEKSLKDLRAALTKQAREKEQRPL